MGPQLYRSPPPHWVAASEEAFSPINARQKWIDNLDWAKRNGLMAGLVIHPWMLMVNPGEVQVVKDVIHCARDIGAWFATVKGLIELAEPALQG